MSIETELTKLQTNMQNAYTSCNNKGATLPANQNFDNLATCIGTISSSGYSEFPRYQVSNGSAVKRSGALTGNEFSGITSVDYQGLQYAFYGCVGLTGTLDLSSLVRVIQHGMEYAFTECIGLRSVNLSSLKRIDDYGLSYAFQNCTSLTSVDLSSLNIVCIRGLQYTFSNCGLTGTLDLSSLTTVSDYGLYYAFQNCTKLTSVNFPLLTTVSDHGLFYTFQNCTSLTSVDFSSLTTITGIYPMRFCFDNCTSITDVYFKALTTSSFESTGSFANLMRNTGTTTTHTLHFPSNMESTISGLSGYPLFGGTSGYVVCAFDLPATE